MYAFICPIGEENGWCTEAGWLYNGDWRGGGGESRIDQAADVWKGWIAQ
jgi:hypothetical protein